MQSEDEHLLDRIKVIESDVKYLKTDLAIEKNNKIPQGEMEAMKVEKQGAQLTTNDQIQKENNQQNNIKRISLDRLSVNTANLSAQSNNQNIVVRKNYMQADAMAGGVLYQGCTFMFGNNNSNELRIVVPGQTIGRAEENGLQFIHINEFKKNVREQAEILIEALNGNYLK